MTLLRDWKSYNEVLVTRVLILLTIFGCLERNWGEKLDLKRAISHSVQHNNNGKLYILSLTNRHRLSARRAIMKPQIYPLTVLKKHTHRSNITAWCRKQQKFSITLSEHSFCDNSQAKMN